MTDADLDAIRALLANVSGGPWRLPYEDGAIARPYDEGDRQTDLDNDVEPDDTDDVSLLGLDVDGMATVPRRADADFIVWCRNSGVADLLDEVERLRAEVARRPPAFVLPECPACGAPEGAPCRGTTPGTIAALVCAARLPPLVTITTGGQTVALATEGADDV